MCNLAIASKNKSKSEMTKAIIFGRFCPLHNAHLALINASSKLCDHTEFGLFIHESDPISADLRIKWLERFGVVHKIHINKTDNPYSDIESSHFTSFDLVAGSNPELIPIAKTLSASHFLWDPAREAMPIDSEQILADVPKHWNDLPDFVRIHAQKRMTFIGPESVGKSFFAKHMAEKYGGPHVPEYGRPHEKYRDKIDYTGAELAELAQRHSASRSAISLNAGPVLFEDTDELMTAVWSEMLIGNETEAIEQQITEPDRYVLYGADTPWENDTLRYFAKKELRQAFFDRIERKLNKHKLSYQTIIGDWQTREAESVAIAEELLSEPFTFC